MLQHACGTVAPPNRELNCPPCFTEHKACTHHVLFELSIHILSTLPVCGHWLCSNCCAGTGSVPTLCGTIEPHVLCRSCDPTLEYNLELFVAQTEEVTASPPNKEVCQETHGLSLCDCHRFG